MIKNQGMLISVVVHILILSIPLPATRMSLSGHGAGDMEISIIEDQSSAAPAGAAEHVTSRPAKESVAKKETTGRGETTGEKPRVKILRQKAGRTTAADREPVRDAAETATEDIQTAAEEGADQYTGGDAAGAGDVRGDTLQEEPSAEAGVVEDPAGTPGQDAIPVSASSGKHYRAAEFGSADGPRFLKRVVPAYPRMARRLGREGRVLLRLVIDEAGRLVDAEVVEKAGFGFDREAMEAVRRSVFLPARENGIPVRSETLLAVRFVLEQR